MGGIPRCVLLFYQIIPPIPRKKIKLSYGTLQNDFFNPPNAATKPDKKVFLEANHQLLRAKAVSLSPCLNKSGKTINVQVCSPVYE